MALIKLKNITKVYGAEKDLPTYALDSVDLEIQEGEMVAIMGPSGSGKSTLLNIIGCLDKPTEGEYFLNGDEVSQLNRNQLAKVRNMQIGFVFQHFALLADHTAQENIELPLIYRGQFSTKISRDDREVMAVEMLKQVGLKDHNYKRPSELSGGEQQRVAIARALVGEPNMLLADEPTGALDQKTGEGIMELLVNINKQGKTVIIVTHDPKVAAHCSRTIRMEDGKIISYDDNGKIE
ncbi:ABC transporter ATP-binding protein [Alkalicella caledoniensis]|uniref:ABC transporter ATP-binding protein n=1 Tax=Alkalicella caledoniensis TaxID=2731377 RepID=A0A7G9WAA1_ALKCA|nr:ABC transporter ATP-binding protein [Alkalicella caledoniensis]QNO15613.1 ABC transporter ATP-binding protein [Alkalicella caledoniensis]